MESDQNEFPMNGGDGKYSYYRNSSPQKWGLDSAKALIQEVIDENLDVKQLLSSSRRVLSIADLGCSVGPNTFFAVRHIIESIKLKSQSQGLPGSDPLEFQVFFNDHVTNDFNTLFKSLPSLDDRPYYTASVPGSFHGRLFPVDSVHFFHSSSSIQWLSKVPEEVVKKDSPACNEGKVYFTSSPREVEEAYGMQFSKDINSFLNARAVELVSGGLMVLIMVSVPPNGKCVLTELFDLLGSALMDLVSTGLVSEDKVDSFNLPMYIPTLEYLKGVIERNGQFKLERIESWLIPSNSDAESTVLNLRAGLEGLVKKHFGSEIVDKVFYQFEKKITDSCVLTNKDYKVPEVLFVTLKR
ncbi:probable S-adenosylmethionine-dependent methyltransferase At5g37990 [Carica papaya]|uniref:probable S-adenosylmethionine-dependent methyltransferase At5g37990 n=1 Tax=Carica papaya TaxID=3649 RepID=UPI000B8D12FA|nr:probable S-adenosylmethionine-dependent methyltransferase At5g37990 [Carica papaya]XP_021888305.1 probable S-adenosylmethionine-dependent methyltransferase At5g37990 [Carica papaya]XP_021888306.1 probable S-adenosylmethionine-dependent methyltransferase At5g37990 [Carica papaya]